MEEFVRGDWAAALPKAYALLATLGCQHAKGVESTTTTPPPPTPPPPTGHEQSAIAVPYRNRCCECFSHVIVTTQLLALNHREVQIKDFLVNWYGGFQLIPAFVLSTWLLTTLEITNARDDDNDDHDHDHDDHDHDHEDDATDVMKIIVDWIEAQPCNTATCDDDDDDDDNGDAKDVTQLVELYCTKILEPTQGITATTVFVNDCRVLSQTNREKVLLTLEQKNSQLLLEKILESSAASTSNTSDSREVHQNQITNTSEKGHQIINGALQQNTPNSDTSASAGSSSGSTWPPFMSGAVLHMFRRRLEKLKRITKWLWIILQSGLRNRDPGIVAKNVAVAMATLIALVTSLTVIIRRSRGLFSSERSKTMLSEVGWAAEQFFSGLI